MVPKVSVVTVTFNCQDVIESTVRSVVNQDYGNVEYIVVDGGSKDDTLDILNRYRSRFAYFISEKDNGIFDAMNKAIIASTGDWILFLNAGDILASANVLSGIFSKSYGGRVGVVFGDVYFRFSTVWHNHLRNKHLTEHLRNNSNELATVRFSAFCGAMLSNNSFLMQR